MQTVFDARFCPGNPTELFEPGRARGKTVFDETNVDKEGSGGLMKKELRTPTFASITSRNKVIPSSNLFDACRQDIWFY